MNSYSALLKKAAAEVDAFLKSGRAVAEPMSRDSWERFRDGFLATADIDGDEAAERELDTDLHHATDSYDLPRDVVPSFWAAVDAMQRRDKRRGKRP